MQIFIDSADPQEIKQAWETGLIDGVTTNPSLAAKVGKPYIKIMEEILETIDSSSTLSLEVIAEDLEGMISQAKKLSKIDERVIVKIPCTTEGLIATKALTMEGILVNVTLVFSPAQALLAAKSGAFYISPFVGRLNDQRQESGFSTVEKIVNTIANYDFHSQILYASVRNVSYVEHAASIGADIVTLPMRVFENLVKHPLTDTGLKKFRSDWEKSGLELPV